MNEKDTLTVSRGVKHIKLLSATTLIALLTSQSVYAADGSSTFLNLGVPGWVWLLIILAILIGITLLPKKWIDPQKNKKLDGTPIKPAPVAKAPVAKAPVAVAKPQAPKVEAAPVTTPAPAAPVAKPAPQAKTQPEVQAKVQPAKPVELDALEEANQLLSQQRFPQAVGVLNKGLQKNPSRSDLMLALLEIYLKQDDHEAFETQFEQLKKLDDPFALIQAEELHRQLDRPVIVEDSDHIEFDTSTAVVPKAEPETTSPAHDYTADSLDFTSAKVQSDDLAFETEKTTAEPETITPIEHEFSLDDIDLNASVSDKKESAEDVSAKSDIEDFDFTTFDLNVPETPKAKVVEIAPVIAKVESPVTPAIVPEVKTPTPLDTTPLVDLDFNFDDSFAVDEDKQDVSKSEKSSWSTDLENERFTPSAAPEPTLGDMIKGDNLSSLEEEFPFLQSVDTFQTRLDLARNYITLGEIASARELLNEVAEQGDSTQQTEARELIAKLAS